MPPPAIKMGVSFGLFAISENPFKGVSLQSDLHQALSISQVVSIPIEPK